MRSLSPDKIQNLGAQVTGSPRAAKKPDELSETLKALPEIVKAFPAQLAEAMASIPPPVIAPRPQGEWIIDVKRDKDGKMSQMVANFHETNPK